MSITVTTPGGDQFRLPQAGDPNWAKDVTNYLYYLKDAQLQGGLIVTNMIVITPTTQTVQAGDAIDPTETSSVRVLTNGSDVVLNGVTPVLIPNGSDGQQLRITCVDETGSVTIPDSGNVDSNGPVTLVYGQKIDFTWDQVLGLWTENNRNN